MHATTATRLLRSGVQSRIETLETQSSSGSMPPERFASTKQPAHHRRRPLQRPPIEPPVSHDKDVVVTAIAPAKATTITHHASMIRRNRLGSRQHNDAMSIDTSTTPQTTASSMAASIQSAPVPRVTTSDGSPRRGGQTIRKTEQHPTTDEPTSSLGQSYSNSSTTMGPLHPLRHGTGARLARSHSRTSTGSNRVAASKEPSTPTRPSLIDANAATTASTPPIQKANLKAGLYQKRSLQLRATTGTPSRSVSPVLSASLSPQSATAGKTGASSASSAPTTPATTKASNYVRRYPSSDLSVDGSPTTRPQRSDPLATPDRSARLLRPHGRMDRYGSSEPPTSATAQPPSPSRQSVQQQQLLLKHQDKVLRRRKSPTHAHTNTARPLQPAQLPLPSTPPQPPRQLQPPRPSPQQSPHHQNQQHYPPRHAVTPEQMSPRRPYDRYQQQETSPRIPTPRHSLLPVVSSPHSSTYDHPYDTSIDEGGRLTLLRRGTPSYQNPGRRPMESDRDYNGGGYREVAGSSEQPTSQYGRDGQARVSHQPVDKSARIARASSSSSDYETDASRGDDDGRNHASSSSSLQQQQEQHDHRYSYKHSDRVLQPEPTFSNMSASQMTPDVAAFFEQTNTSAVSAPRSVRDDDTYDYGDRDDNIVDDSNLDEDDDDDDDDDNASQGSLSYEQRRQKLEREREARAAAVAAAKAELDGPFMQQDDVEHYRKAVDTPLGRTAAGVAVAATLGCILLGPVGLLVGAAAVGIGAGYMQIPEEQRQNMNNKATDAIRNAQESAYLASEKLSNSCALSYRDSGIADHVPVEIETCCTTLAGMDEDAFANVDNDASVLDNEATRERDVNGNEILPAGGGGTKVSEKRKSGTPTHHASWLREKKGKVACLRKGKVIPLAQIHALDPSAQPRAWLDVLASAETSHDEKIEAIEEILILAKDKQKSRVFVDEGILDCLLWTIERYFEKQSKGPGSENWAHPNVTSQEATAARLSATCCLTLGKSYCAAIHTEGDLLLMSLYDRGTVPEERQLAQMLLEVPHHARSTRTDDPTIVTPGKEVFALKQLTLPQAEELAASIATLASTPRPMNGM